MKIIHIADIHWRGLSRHEEYRESFSAFFNKARELAPDVIYVGGDIVHSKTQGISPELIDCLTWWFTNLADIAPTHIILGNHDGIMFNKSRQDAITPIIDALDNPNLYLYKKSGTYPTGVPGYNWCVFSCFDEEGWDKVIPDDKSINMALFHGGVRSSVTDIDWEIEGEVTSDFFSKFNFALLGDIHRHQYLDSENRVAYPGSTIQQNYGEDPGKGFLFWEIEDKDSFTSTFYEIPHSKPFITIDWDESVKKTLLNSGEVPIGARVRVRSNTLLPHASAKQIQGELERQFQASEVVFKSEGSFDSSSIFSKKSKKSSGYDLRDAAVHKSLLREYYSDLEVAEDTWSSIDTLVDSYVMGVTDREEVTRNTSWSINKMRFDNLFAYGEDNIVNFDTIPGVTGIFGKNTRGKSSIVGSLMYGLFNTTDRGSIKNEHIINNRKNSCKAIIDLTINSNRIQVERSTVKHQTRKGSTYASTGLSLKRVNESGEVLENLSGEQRRETEKILRKMIGTHEDFLMTSLASQGQMNMFIKEKATSRKLILTKFLDLEIFEKIYEKAKEDSLALRQKLRAISDTDWDNKILDQETDLVKNKNLKKAIESDIAQKREILQNLLIEIATSSDIDIVTEEEVNNQSNIVKNYEKELRKLREYLETLTEDLAEQKIKIEKILQVRKDFPIDEILQKLETQRDLEKSVLKIRHTQEMELAKLDRQLKSVARLSEVPCGDSFPTCKFIKDSHDNKRKISIQKKLVKSLVKEISDIEDHYNKIKDESLEKRIKKYEILSQKESEISLKISEININIANCKNSIENNEIALAKEKNVLNEKIIRSAACPETGELVETKQKINALELKISDSDKERIGLSDKITRSKVEISRLKKERDSFTKIKKDLKVYDMILQSASKKGIPLQIMMTQLPVINEEISKILQGVVGFTVELEADPGSNAMDIFINYGDSKRIIELASGMEKMMASLAIRVALINVSSLPKTNTIIIDEGFGALDENNIEACSRLLVSLKKWFRNILVISHVDAIKDTVDNSLDIMRIGKNAKVSHE